MTFARLFSDRSETLLARIGGGEKQPVMISCCVMKQPNFVLVHDVNTSLDIRSNALVRKTIEKLFRHYNRTVYLSWDHGVINGLEARARTVL